MKSNQKIRSHNRSVTGSIAFEPDDRLQHDESGQVIAELQVQLKFQKLISDISATFVNLPADKIDSEIENGLKFILEFMKIDRCTFAEFSESSKNLRVTHSTQKSGIEISQKYLVNERFPWLGRKLFSEETVAIENPSDFPKNAVNEIEYCRGVGLKSILIIPVSVGGYLMNAIAFTTFTNYHTWPKDTIEQLRVLGEVFANAIYRKRAEEEIRKNIQNLSIQYDFEHLISGLSARFVDIKNMPILAQIEESQQLLIEYLGVDRCIFFRISEDRNELIPVASYAVEGVDRLGNIPIRSWFPWAAERLLSGNEIIFSREDELPADADIDRSNLIKINLKSTILVPISVDGTVKYALSVGSIKQPHVWSEGIASRLQLVGEIFVNALIRSNNQEIMQKNQKELEAANKRIKKISEQLARENRYYQEEISAEFQAQQIIGNSSGLKYIFYRLNQVAQMDTTVLIQGETGTGKELIARALHKFSNRKDRPLIKIDCTTLHDSMIESELFGHEKGAFTGAHDRHIGRMELADNGTIFLDEVGEIPLSLQSKILRVIEEGEFERLGGSTTHKVDMRVIAATNRDLEDEVRNGNFRRDLFYRLNVFPLTLPPLRERKEDIPALTEWFIEHLNKQMSKNFGNIPGDMLKTLQDYSWPGNIRELRNVVERAMITSEGSVLQLMDILTVQKTPEPYPVSGESLREVEMRYIRRVLEESQWRIEGTNGAAQKLGLHPDTLRSRMKKLGIRRPPPNK